jgi:hypothetical protein
MFTARELWDAIPFEDRMEILDGGHQQYRALHRIKEELLSAYVPGEAIGILDMLGDLLMPPERLIDAV